jgi:uncharacterized membrane-anchored protein
MTTLRHHPLADQLSRELHARPFGTAPAPAQLFHYALMHGREPAGLERDRLAELCRLQAVPEPAQGSVHFVAQTAAFRLTWERHSEFSTYTFLVPGERSEEDARQILPVGWIESLPGEMIAATHMVLATDIEYEPVELERWFGGRPLIGGNAVGGRARIWTPFARDEDGVVRVWIHSLALTESQAGRLVQRLLEIHSYTMMAMLALPVAWEIMPTIGQIEAALLDVAEISTKEQSLEEERLLLGRLSQLAAKVEALAARTPFRFNAARAYHAIVQRRVLEIREERIEGQQTINNFLERRLAPAIRTIVATQERVEALSARVARASDMLRTRVDIQLAEQNRNLLASMDRRVRLQLRLQAAVEGLSIAAITYYSVGLVHYVTLGAVAVGIELSEDVVVGAAVPTIAFGTWIAMRRTRRKIGHE